MRIKFYFRPNIKSTRIVKLYFKLLLALTGFSVLNCGGGNDETTPNGSNEIVANFSVSSTIINQGESIQISNQTTGSVTHWNWTFEGGSPATSTERHPTVTYSEPGEYTISLKARNANDQTEATKTENIRVKEIIEPPYAGTIFIDANIITADDPTIYEKIEAKGTGTRTMFDRRVNNWIEVEAHLFEVTFQGKVVEAQVNPEFTAEAALNHATKYAEIIGRMPKVLFKDLNTIWIHDGNNPFGGGNNNLLIHIGQALDYEAAGIIEEVFIHEAAHTSLDADHAQSEGWAAAQKEDPTYISTYARDNNIREDVAESFLPYLAVKFKSERLSEEMINTIRNAMPSRIVYFDGQNFDFAPWGN